MTILRQDRGALDAALAQPALALLLLSGPDAGTARAVHDYADGLTRETPWRQVFLLTDLAVLTADETARWFQGQTGRWVGLQTSHADAVGRSGTVEELLDAAGAPDPFLVRRAFRRP